MVKLIFESQTCTRCQGSGKYSFNLRDGDRCYGCGGSGVALTKRGKVAQKFFTDSRMVLVSDLVIGDVVRNTSVTLGGDAYNVSAKIESIEPSHVYSLSLDGVRHHYIEIKYKTKRGIGTYMTFADHKVEVLNRDRAGKIAQALAYQATLGVTGKPLKKKRAQIKVASQCLTLSDH